MGLTSRAAEEGAAGEVQLRYRLETPLVQDARCEVDVPNQEKQEDRSREEGGGGLTSVSEALATLEQLGKVRVVLHALQSRVRDETWD